MSDERCILTTKDFTILEMMADRCPTTDPLLPLLRRKLETATVVFRDDVTPDVATIGSRVAFRSGDGRSETRILSREHMASPVGTSLPVTTRRGLVLLGLVEGQVIGLEGQDGKVEHLLLERVVYQPEASGRESEAGAAAATPAARRASWRIISGSGRPRPAAGPISSGDLDDPGPSAA